MVQSGSPRKHDYSTKKISRKAIPPSSSSSSNKDDDIISHAIFRDMGFGRFEDLAKMVRDPSHNPIEKKFNDIINDFPGFREVLNEMFSSNKVNSKRNTTHDDASKQGGP